jgi:hypothetical protein
MGFWDENQNQLHEISKILRRGPPAHDRMSLNSQPFH